MLLGIAACLVADAVARAQQLHPSHRVQAGEGTQLETSGSGEATFYLVGPGVAIKRQVKLGFDVTRFGARGDGVTIDTDAINRAIEAAARPAHGNGQPGGTVYFPAGTYASYSIHLQSNVALYLAQNATILAAAPANGKGYDPAEPGAGNPFQDFGHSHWHNSLIWGEGLENVTIEGPGKIDGKRPAGSSGHRSVSATMAPRAPRPHDAPDRGGLPVGGAGAYTGCWSPVAARNPRRSTGTRRSRSSCAATSPSATSRSSTAAISASCRPAWTISASTAW